MGIENKEGLADRESTIAASGSAAMGIENKEGLADRDSTSAASGIESKGGLADREPRGPAIILGSPAPPFNLEDLEMVQHESRLEILPQLAVDFLYSGDKLNYMQLQVLYKSLDLDYNYSHSSKSGTPFLVKCN